MSNLCYFCHYHRGNAKEKTIKIAGSFLIASMLFTWGFSAQISKAAQEYNELTSTLIPEPGYLIAAELAQNTEPATSGSSGGQSQPVQIIETPATTVAPPAADGTVSQPAQQTCRVNGVDMPGSCEKYQPKLEQPAVDEDNRDQFEEERQKQEVTQWKADRLRETKNLLKEIEKVRKQFIRLKGSIDEVAKLEAMKANVTEFINKVNTTTDADDLRGILEENDFGEWWQELDKLRAAVEIPRDLNNIRKDQKRAQTILKQKWVCKLIDCNSFTPVIQNMGAQLEEATRLYQTGEYEDARAVIQETFHERGWFGDAMGAVQMMRGFLEPLKQIRDKDLKAQMEELVQPVKDLLYEGEVREARESMEAIQKELGPSMFKLIMNAQKKKQAVPEKVLDKIEQLRQKFEQQVQEELKKVPAEETAPVQPVQ